MQRIKHWVHLIRAGYSAAPAIISYITLVVGGSVGLAFEWGRKHLVWGVVLLLAAVVVTLLEGSYRESRHREEAHAQELGGVRSKHAEELSALRSEHSAALAEAQAKSAAVAQAPTFWDVKGGNVHGNEIVNTYNESRGTGPEQAGFGGRLITVGPNSGIVGSEIYVEFGPRPPLPDPLPSTPEERTLLRDRLLKLADDVETVMTPWGLNLSYVAKKMGVPSDQFMARITEIRSERDKLSNEAAARYVNECRAAVMQTYARARSIGFVDDDMEGWWQTRLGAGASAIPARLRAIAMRIHDLGGRSPGNSDAILLGRGHT